MIVWTSTSTIPMSLPVQSDVPTAQISASYVVLRNEASVCVSKRMPAMVSRGNSGRSNQTKRIKSYALTRADSTKPQVQQSSCPSDPPSILSPRASSPSSLALLLIFLLRRPHLYPLRMTCSWNKTQSPSRSTRSDHRCPSPSDNR